MKLAGPAEFMAKAWADLGKNIKLEKPKGNDESVHTFLGCTHTRSTRVINGKVLQCVDHNVAGAMRRAIAKYDEAVFDATGTYPHLYPVSTPFLDEETKTAEARAPNKPGPFIECPSCLHTMPVADAENLHTFPEGTKRSISKILNKSAPIVSDEETAVPEDEHNTDVWSDNDDKDEWWSDMLPKNVSKGQDTYLRGAPDPMKPRVMPIIPINSKNVKYWQEEKIKNEAREHEKQNAVQTPTNLYNPNKGLDHKNKTKGCLGNMAAMMIMTLLYSVRLARFDMFKALNFLAKRITRWDEKCDRRLHRLMCYVQTTVDYQMVGWMGDNPDELTPHLFCDADFAGCPYTLKSTTGGHMDLQGPNSRFPWSAGSNQQTSTAQSTPEAELNSLNAGMRLRGEPAIDIWGVLLKRYHQDDPNWKLVINVHEDNTTAIIGARTGKNPTMKTLERGHGVSIAWINERIISEEYNLIHTGTKYMTADIYTKGFVNKVLWDRLRKLINVYSPKEIEELQFTPIPDDDDLMAQDGVMTEMGNPVNTHYFEIMRGESTLTTDFRKPAKVKPMKKPKKKGVVTAYRKPKPNDVDSDVKPMQGPREAVDDDIHEIPDVEWTVILLCTNPASFMQQCNPFPKNCTVVDITKEDDFTSESGYQKVVSLLRDNLHVAI